MKKIINKYADFVSHNPWKMLLIVFIISIIAFNFASKVGTKSQSYKDMLPDGYQVIEAFDVLGDNFGTGDSAMIVIEVDPEYASSNEIRDLRDSRSLQYINILTELSKHIDNVISTTSLSSILKQMNNNVVPKSNQEIKSLIEDNPLTEQYISKDFQTSIIKISLSDDYDEFELVDDLNEIIEQIPKVPGLIAKPAGDVIADPIVQKQIGPDMGKTSQFSLIGIILVLIILFRSIRYSFTPLSVIAIGVLWAFGYLGLIKMGLTSATSGVISMIMGIGIDFGIQIVTRFRYELKFLKIELAMSKTMSSVFMPMATTTLSALIGFKAMSMGQLTMMGEFGQIMSYGISSCFLAAITVVPSLLVIGENLHEHKIKQFNLMKFIKKIGKKIILTFKK